MNSELQRSRREFQDYVDDVVRSTHQTFGDTLARLLSVLDSGSPLGELASRILPGVDFDRWQELQLGRAGGMGGRGVLAWPMSSDERVAMQLELLRRVNDNRIEFWNFCHTFLDARGKFDDNVHAFAQHIVRPFARDFLRLLQQRPEMVVSPAVVPPPSTEIEFVAPDRIAALAAISSSPFNLRKLVRLCEELSICYRHRCFFAVAILTRAVLDHVPPVFGQRTFAEVVNNYSWPKSKRDALSHLENSARKIADLHLHTSASSVPALPNAAQVNFGPNIDLLLEEIVRVLTKNAAGSSTP